MYSREFDGQAVQFGTTGYTMDNVFVLYDRLTESVWYPLKDGQLDAVAGPHMGSSIPYLAEPAPQPLRAWLKEHPTSTVLLPGPDSKSLHDIEADPDPTVQVRRDLERWGLD